MVTILKKILVTIIFGPIAVILLPSTLFFIPFALSTSIIYGTFHKPEVWINKSYYYWCPFCNKRIESKHVIEVHDLCCKPIEYRSEEIREEE